MNDRYSYWEECLEASFSEHGISITPEQLACIAGDVEGAFECYGMAYPTPESPLIGEVETLKRELKKEREKIICEVCNGRGRIIILGPYHSSDSQCWKCRGEGRHDL